MLPFFFRISHSQNFRRVLCKVFSDIKYEKVRYKPVRRAELASLAPNRFSRVFFEKLAKIVYKFTKITNFGAKSWKNSENFAFFLKNKSTYYWPFFLFLRGLNRFIPLCFIVFFFCVINLFYRLIYSKK